MGKRDQRRRRKKIREREVVNQLEGVEAARIRRIQERIQAQEEARNSCTPGRGPVTMDKFQEERGDVPSQDSIYSQ